MKKIFRRTGKIIVTAILAIFLLLLILPVLFKGKIGEQVVKVANEQIDANLSFTGYSLSLIRNFPNLTFSLNDLVITGKDQFNGDTLAGLRSFRLVFDLSSVFGKEGYVVKSVVVDRPVVNGIALADGSVNWDIMKESEQADVTEETGEGKAADSSSSLKASLESLEIRNGRLTYMDQGSEMSAVIDNMNLHLAGNMAESITDLALEVDMEGITFIMDGTAYLKEAVAKGLFDLSADMDQMRFTLNENSLSLNALMLTLSGTIAMEGERILTDIQFGTGETGFRDILSMVPAVYLSGFEDIRADGTLVLDGTASGVYSGSDSLYPDISLGVRVNNGSVSYPGLPGKISGIEVTFNAAVDGENPDLSVVDLENFSFDIEGNPFRMSFSLRTPLSDPGITGMAEGRIDLASLAEAVPLDGTEMSGVIVTDMTFGGSYSMLEQERYEEFTADGSLSVRDISVKADGMPELIVAGGDLLFSPASTSLQNLKVNIGASDIAISGILSNYLPYLLRGETITGEMTLNSALIDAGELLSYFPEDTMAVEEEMTLPDRIIIPDNIDFTFSSEIDKLIFPPLAANDIRGNIVVQNGTVSVLNTGLRAVGGNFDLDAVYDTRDTLNPVIGGSLRATDISLLTTFETFNTVRQLAPVAEGMEGNITAALQFSSVLGKGLMPVINSISGGGSFRSEEIALVSSPIFDKFSSLFKLDDSFSNRFRDIDLLFTVDSGRVFIKPFETTLGVIGMTISGDHGIDQSINYNIRTEMPSRYLPESLTGVINSMAAQAAMMGIQYKMPETLKVNMNVGGTVQSPRIVPSLDGSGAVNAASLKEGVTGAAKEAVSGLIDDTEGKVAEEVAAQAAKLIAAAEQEAARVREEAAKVAAGIRAEADSAAVKLEKEAESKGAIARLAAERAAKALRDEADKRAVQVESEADKRAEAIIEEAKRRASELK